MQIMLVHICSLPCLIKAIIYNLWKTKTVSYRKEQNVLYQKGQNPIIPNGIKFCHAKFDKFLPSQMEHYYNPFGSVCMFHGSPVMLYAPDISSSFVNLTRRHLALQLRSSMCCSILQKHRAQWVELSCGPSPTQ